MSKYSETAARWIEQKTDRVYPAPLSSESGAGYTLQMKLITLNTWGGRVGDPFLDFFKKYNNVEVFLLQEVFHQALERVNFMFEGIGGRMNLFDELCEILPDHQGYFAVAQSEGWGLASFVHKKITVAEEGDIFVHRSKDAMIETDGKTLGKNIQYLKIVSQKRNFTAINFHGLWNGGEKTDTGDRINQSKKILNFTKSLSGDFVLGGDFNLLPTTKSLKMLEREAGLRNLVREYGVTSTRTSFYTKPHKFADYVLITPGIKVVDFKVLSDEVSDHAPLYLEFE